jgi:hypothetical protein
MHLAIVEGDLLDQDVDVIVNAWNRNIVEFEGEVRIVRFKKGTGRN